MNTPEPSTVAAIVARLKAWRFDLSTLTPAERAILIRNGAKSRKDLTPIQEK